jgi:hypothetical protein
MQCSQAFRTRNIRLDTKGRFSSNRFEYLGENLDSSDFPPGLSEISMNFQICVDAPDVFIHGGNIVPSCQKDWTAFGARVAGSSV